MTQKRTSSPKRPAGKPPSGDIPEHWPRRVQCCLRFGVWEAGTREGGREDLSKRFDRDELLALGLAYARERYAALAQTQEEVLASARAARARAIETRKELPASRERSRAAFTEAMKARERMPNSERGQDREQKQP